MVVMIVCKKTTVLSLVLHRRRSISSSSVWRRITVLQLLPR